MFMGDNHITAHRGENIYFNPGTEQYYYRQSFVEFASVAEAAAHIDQRIESSNGMVAMYANGDGAYRESYHD